jgi:hypothetical protein
MTSFKRTLRPLEQSVLFEIGVESDPTRVALPTRVAERPTKKARDRRDVFNGRLLDGLTLVGPHDIPKIDACSLVPERLIAFTEASKMGQPDPQAWVHAYEDDSGSLQSRVAGSRATLCSRITRWQVLNVWALLLGHKEPSCGR